MISYAKRLLPTASEIAIWLFALTAIRFLMRLFAGGVAGGSALHIVLRVFGVLAIVALSSLVLAIPFDWYEHRKGHGS